MTIARTGNRIVDSLARASKANQAKEQAAKSKAAKAAKSSGRMSKVRAGRAAVKAGATRGRGCVAKVHKSGKSVGGLLNYCMDKPEATLISSNCGTNKAEIDRDITRCTKLRNIKDPILHLSLSLSPGQTATHEVWREMTDVVRDGIGLHDSFSFAAILHDEEIQNAHIAASRVSDQGEIFNDYRLGLRLAAIEDIIEDRFGLKLVPVVRDQSKINLGKPEIEKAIRTNIQPERMRLNSIVTQAASGKQSVVEFISKCARAGVVVRPNLATTGKLSGFSFGLADSNIEFAGSKIKCGWAELQKMGVHYEQTTEFEALADLSAAINSGQRTIAPADSGQVESCGQRMADPRGQTESADQPSKKDNPDTESADRPANKTPTVSSNFERMRELNVRRAARRIFFADLRAALTKIGSPAAARLTDALDADQTESEIAAAFIVAEKCSSESRELIQLLKLDPNQIADVLRPWREIIKMEADAAARMSDAVRSAPVQDNQTQTALPTF